MSGYTQPLPFDARAADFVSANNFDYMHPYMTPRMAQELSPTNKAANAGANRRVVPRPRSISPSAARSATAAPTAPTQTSGRRVVQRPGTVNAARAASNNAAAAVSSARSGALNSGGQINSARGMMGGVTGEIGAASDVSIAQCMSEYKKCMDSYCSRPNTKYDRCYCSPRMAQLDSEFQPKIEQMQKRLVALSIGGKYTDFETMSQGIEFDWISAENRIQGQEAFLTAGRVCVERIKPCFSFAAQLVNLYRSEMGRDCQRYEAYLNIHLQMLEQEMAKFY